jgi:dTDP-4-amino-4,6-dideoxygalactose transaminase
VDLHAEYGLLRAEILEALDRVFTGMHLYLGPETESFEAEWAAFCGVEHAVAVATGTDALLFALLAAGIGPGDEVITVGWTFIATLEAIVHAGAVPVVVDVDRDTLTMDPARVADAVTPRTRAILPVHIYGHPADMAPLMDLAAAHDLFVLEDAAQAHGAAYHGRRAGALGHAAAFSFYVTKNLSAYGEGGMVTTNDAEAADNLKMLRNHGRSETGHALVGYNGRMQEVQAAILRVKMRWFAEGQARRRAIAARYDEALAGLPVRLPVEREGCTHAYHLYMLRAADRDALKSALEQAGVAYAIHYPTPANRQPAMAPWGLNEVDLPVSEQAAREVLALPVHPMLTDDQIGYVCDVVRRAFGG